MSTIRPLATIAVLAVIGAFLAWKISNGPAVALDDSWAPAPDAEAAPAWGGTPDAADPQSSPASEGPSEWGAPLIDETPIVEPELELPPLKAIDDPSLRLGGDPTPSFGASPPTATNQQLELPADIPEATYSAVDDDAAPAQPPDVSGRVPSLGAVTPDLVAEQSPLDTAWPAIQSALGRNELTRAHRMLSMVADEPSVAPARREEVDTLLAELAGTVIYSMEHRLEPPHTVAAGESLATIADQYQVPWQLLAKINGVRSSDGVTPGQTLKVVRGPFEGRVDLQRGELVLTLDGRYAGRFLVTPDGPAPNAGAWTVDAKQDDSVAAPGQRIVLSDSRGGSVELSSAPAPTPGGRLSIASGDMSDVFDILSVGSRVTIVR